MKQAGVSRRATLLSAALSPLSNLCHAAWRGQRAAPGRRGVRVQGERQAGRDRGSDLGFQIPGRRGVRVQGERQAGRDRGSDLGFQIPIPCHTAWRGQRGAPGRRGVRVQGERQGGRRPRRLGDQVRLAAHAHHLRRAALRARGRLLQHRLLAELASTHCECWVVPFVRPNLIRVCLLPTRLTKTVECGVLTLPLLTLNTALHSWTQTWGCCHVTCAQGLSAWCSRDAYRVEHC